MRILLILFIIVATLSYGQNQNISEGNIFDGEPYISINPTNSQHMVVAWMGYFPYTKIFIKTKVSFDGGATWGNDSYIEHANSTYGSADPSIEFDNLGNVFISYIDYNADGSSGAVYLVKSTDNGITWGTPTEVINLNADAGKYPIDRPWMSIDRSNGVNNGNIYITTMPPGVFGPLSPPFHPYFMVSTDNGDSFSAWKYLDTTNWLSGNIIQQPMPTNCVSGDGTFYAVYPSYLISQSYYAQYIIASTTDAGNSFNYNNVFYSTGAVSDSLAKIGYLLRSNPNNVNHLAFFYLDDTYGDIDIFMIESFDKGVNWSSAIRINDDPIANDRMQDLVWADFDNDGDLVVSWRDRRNANDSIYTTSSEIWASTRFNDSTNFSANFVISDNLVAYDTILAYSGNDFMCIKLVDDTLNAVWGDTRNGKLNIWYQRMSINGTVLSVQNLSSENILEIKLFPNPTASYIDIEGCLVSAVNVYNTDGKIVLKSKNTNRIDLTKLENSTYILQITTPKGIVNKRIVKK